MAEGELLQAIYDNMQSMKTDILTMKDDMQGMKTDMLAMKDDMQGMKQHITNIRLTLENETNPNIKVIAEGHLDLNRKLDHALKVENEKEMLIIRVNILENEIRKIKERLDQIA